MKFYYSWNLLNSFIQNFPAANKIINSLQQLTGGSAIISLVYDDFRKAKKEFNIQKEFNKEDIILIIILRLKT